MRRIRVRVWNRQSAGSILRRRLLARVGVDPVGVETRVDGVHPTRYVRPPPIPPRRRGLRVPSRSRRSPGCSRRPHADPSNVVRDPARQRVPHGFVPRRRREGLLQCGAARRARVEHALVRAVLRDGFRAMCDRCMWIRRSSSARMCIRYVFRCEVEDEVVRLDLALNRVEQTARASLKKKSAVKSESERKRADRLPS